MKRAILPSAREQLAAEVERLPQLKNHELAERWRELFGSERPRRIYGELLVGVLAYRLQEKVLGGLKPSTRRLFREVAGNPGERRSTLALGQPRLKAEAVLLREWRGATHRVAVLEHSFEYGGESFTSLSEIARRITGSRWSGPLFFDLKTRKRGNAVASA